MNRLLITGATGFLGVPSVARAIAEFEVHAVARRGGPLAPQAVYHACDLFDPDAVGQLLRRVRPTHLLHLRGSRRPVCTDVARELRLGGGVEHLLRVRGSRREASVIAGTAEYDWTAADVREFTRLLAPRPCTAGARTSREWAEACGVDVAARLFFLYGPREHPRGWCRRSRGRCSR